jgi:hypothetical protein
MIVKIPTLLDGTAHYSLRTTLDGIDYEVHLDWSSRESRWYFSLYTAEGDLLCGQTKVFANHPVLRYYKHRPGMPPGDILAVTTLADDTPPGLYELGIGARCELTYLPAGSLA